MHIYQCRAPHYNIIEGRTIENKKNNIIESHIVGKF